MIFKTNNPDTDFSPLMMRQRLLPSIALALGLLFMAASAQADEKIARTGIIKRLMEQRHSQSDDASATNSPSSTQELYVQGKGKSTTHTINGREFIVYTPATTASRETHSLLVVLHGGFGNASQIQSYIGLEPYADQYGFLIAYLNGTKVARLLRERRAGWNAGECCGLPQENNVDDVGFVTQAVGSIIAQYGVDPQQVYGTGHSNGAMMTYRLLCETSLYRAAAPYSGTLELAVDSCPLVRGKRIMAIHGAEDQNLPVEGGYTIKGMNKKTNYRSQAYTQEVFTRSGADYHLLILPGAAHKPETLNAALLKTEGVTLPQKIVTSLGLGKR